MLLWLRTRSKVTGPQVAEPVPERVGAVRTRPVSRRADASTASSRCDPGSPLFFSSSSLPFLPSLSPVLPDPTIAERVGSGRTPWSGRWPLTCKRRPRGGGEGSERCPGFAGVRPHVGRGSSAARPQDDRSRTPLQCDLFARPKRLTVQPRARSAGAQTVCQSRVVRQCASHHAS